MKREREREESLLDAKFFSLHACKCLSSMSFQNQSNVTGVASSSECRPRERNLRESARVVLAVGLRHSVVMQVPLCCVYIFCRLRILTTPAETWPTPATTGGWTPRSATARRSAPVTTTTTANTRPPPHNSLHSGLHNNVATHWVAEQTGVSIVVVCASASAALYLRRH